MPGTLRGRRGTWRHPPSYFVAGAALSASMALGWLWWRACAPLVAGDAAARGRRDIHLRFAWRASHFQTSTLFAWQAWHLWHWAGSGGALGAPLVAGDAAALRGRRGTWRHPPSFCEAGVALSDVHILFAWQVWHLWHCAGSGGRLGWHVLQPTACKPCLAMSYLHARFPTEYDGKGKGLTRLAAHMPTVGTHEAICNMPGQRPAGGSQITQPAAIELPVVSILVRLMFCCVLLYTKQVVCAWGQRSVSNRV